MREMGSLQPDASPAERKARAMAELLDQVCEHFAEGMLAIYARAALVKMEPDPVGESGEQLRRPTLPSLDRLAYRLAQAHPGQGPGEACGLDAEQLTLMFLAAAELLDDGQLEQAEKAFHALTCLCPDAGIFWRGLGECQQERGDLQAALEAYRAASFVQSDDVASYVHCALLASELQDHETLKALNEQAQQAQLEASSTEGEEALSELVATLRQMAD